MRFFREYLILALIIVFVTLTELITLHVTNICLENINYDIRELELAINENNDVYDKMQKLLDEWRTVENKLSFYMEHNELEKISSDVINLESNIRTNDNVDSIEKLNEVEYRLIHVKNKQRLKLKNIF